MTQLSPDLPAYLARPDGPAAGGLVLIHEIWGLVDQIKDVADRFAAEGYLVVAPDLFTHAGIPAEAHEELQRLLAGSAEERAQGQPRLREIMAPVRAPGYAEWAVGALRSAVDRVSEDLGADQDVAVSGFCFGGSYSFALAAADPRIKAAVPFYGAPPELDDVARIGCPVLAFYGENDTRLTDGLPELQRAMAEAGVDFTAQVYPGTGHAFFNDANPQVYDAAAAVDAWSRTLAFLEAALRPHVGS